MDGEHHFSREGAVNERQTFPEALLHLARKGIAPFFVLLSLVASSVLLSRFVHPLAGFWWAILAFLFFLLVCLGGAFGDLF